MNKGGSAFQGLDQIRLQSIFQKCCYRAFCMQVAGSHRFAGTGVSHDDPGHPLLQIQNVACQAEHCHDLGGHGDIETVLTGHAVRLGSQAVHDAAELPVIHIHAPPPGYPVGVDIQGVSLMDVIVQHGRDQVISRADGMQIASEMQVDVLHGDHLCVAAAGSAALHAEYRSKGGLS